MTKKEAQSVLTFLADIHKQLGEEMKEAEKIKDGFDRIMARAELQGKVDMMLIFIKKLKTL